VKQSSLKEEIDPVAKILVIDDEKPLRAFLWAALRFAGHEVGEAGDRAEGLRALRRGSYDLVLCDLFMPVKEGIETIPEIRRDFPALPVIAMSGGSLPGQIDMLPVALRLGATRTLRKPFHPAELLGAVDAALGQPAPSVTS
jgi:CheY-like chemotaxis protein